MEENVNQTNLFSGTSPFTAILQGIPYNRKCETNIMGLFAIVRGQAVFHVKLYVLAYLRVQSRYIFLAFETFLECKISIRLQAFHQYIYTVPNDFLGPQTTTQ